MEMVEHPYDEGALLPEVIADYVGSSAAYGYEMMRLDIDRAFEDGEFVSNSHELGDEVTIYRGTNSLLLSGDAFEDGCIPYAFEMSWTLNKDKAIHFAGRNASFTSGSIPKVMELTVPRELIMYHVGGSEEEVLFNFTHPDAHDLLCKAGSEAYEVESSTQSWAQKFGK